MIHLNIIIFGQLTQFGQIAPSLLLLTCFFRFDHLILHKKNRYSTAAQLASKLRISSIILGRNTRVFCVFTIKSCILNFLKKKVRVSCIRVYNSTIYSAKLLVLRAAVIKENIQRYPGCSLREQKLLGPVLRTIKASLVRSFSAHLDNFFPQLFLYIYIWKGLKTSLNIKGSTFQEY